MVDNPPPSRRHTRRRNKGPKPWFVLKLSVAIAAAIIAYAGYVYIGRLCIPMIKRESDSLGSRRLGSKFLCPTPPLPVVCHCDFDFALDTFILTFSYVPVFLGLSVIFLIVFVVLGMMMIWAYIKVRTRLYNTTRHHPTPMLSAYAYI